VDLIRRYIQANFEMRRNVQMPFPGACIRPMAILSNDQVYKFGLEVVGRSWGGRV